LNDRPSRLAFLNQFHDDAVLRADERGLKPIDLSAFIGGYRRPESPHPKCGGRIDFPAKKSQTP
jgi:hypothetical protein